MPKKAKVAGPVRYLDKEQVAAMLDRSPKTIQNRFGEGRMPEPDAFIDNHPGWLEETIRTWWDALPGPGNRVTGPERRGGTPRKVTAT